MANHGMDQYGGGLYDNENGSSVYKSRFHRTSHTLRIQLSDAVHRELRYHGIDIGFPSHTNKK